MGALTLKSFPFVLRSWNVKNINSQDLSDVFEQETNTHINRNKAAKIKLQFAGNGSNLWLTNRGRMLFLSFPTKISYDKYLNKFYFRIRSTLKKFYFKTNHFFKQFLRESLPNKELQVSSSTLLGMTDPTSFGPEGLILVGVFGAVVLIMKVSGGIMRRIAGSDSESDDGSIDIESYDTPHNFDAICQGFCGPRIREITTESQLDPDVIAHFFGEISANDMTWPKLLLEATQAGEIHGNLAVVSSTHGELACIVMAVMGINRIFVPVHQIAIVGRFFEIFLRNEGEGWDPSRRWGASHNPTNAEMGLLGSNSRFEIPQDHLNLLQGYFNRVGREGHMPAFLPQMSKYPDIDLSHYYDRVNLFLPDYRRDPVAEALYNLSPFGTRLFDITMKYGLSHEKVSSFVREIVDARDGKLGVINRASEVVQASSRVVGRCQVLESALPHNFGRKADFEEIIEIAINMNGTYSWSDFDPFSQFTVISATRYVLTKNHLDYFDSPVNRR